MHVHSLIGSKLLTVSPGTATASASTYGPRPQDTASASMYVLGLMVRLWPQRMGLGLQVWPWPQHITGLNVRPRPQDTTLASSYGLGLNACLGPNAAVISCSLVSTTDFLCYIFTNVFNLYSGEAVASQVHFSAAMRSESLLMYFALVFLVLLGSTCD